MKKRIHLYWYSLLFAAVFIIERITKWWAFTYLADRVIDVFPGLRLVLSWNRGISWSMLIPTTKYGSYLLTGAICLVSLSFLFYTFLEYRKNRSIFFEILVLVGAFSNLLDRFLFGAVIDFVECYAWVWHFPVFNGADVLVVGGILGIFLKILRRD